MKLRYAARRKCARVENANIVIRCYITDRKSLPSEDALLATIARNLAAGVDWIQIREKDLSARDLLALVCNVKALPMSSRATILVNSRTDVALAAGADGVHLPADSIPPKTLRPTVPAEFLIGVSCHTTEEVRQAETDDADYVLFGPVFAPISKSSDLAARGLEGLAEAVLAVSIPVIALGGITRKNVDECVTAGAKGIAGISLFQRD
jgi:thiamine-phosphate pyrophosphorylase